MTKEKKLKFIAIFLLVISFNLLVLSAIYSNLEKEVVNYRYSDVAEYDDVKEAINFINSFPIQFNITNEYFSNFDNLEQQTREMIIMSYVIKNKYRTYSCEGTGTICIKKEDLQGGKRGRKGVNIKPPKNANLINTLYTTNLGVVAAFTNAGRMYNFSLAELDYDKDYSIYELIVLQDNEKVLLLIDTTSFNSYHNLVTISHNGYIKKTATREYNIRAKKGTAVMKLDDNDLLVGVYLSMQDEDKIFIAGSGGNYNFYALNELSTTGRLTKGVKAIKLNTNEFIRAATLIKANINYRGLLTITTTGKGKITKLEDFNTTSRAVKGSQVMALKDENLATVFAVPISQEKIFITTNNKAVLLNVDSIPIQNRVTSGVRIIDARGVESGIEIM